MFKGPILYAIIAVIIIIAVLFFVVGRKTKKGGVGSKPLKPSDLPNSGNGIPAGWSPTPTAEAAYNMMKGLNFACYKSNGAMFKELAELDTDDMLAAVAIDFKNRYGESLLAWIQDETPCGWVPDSEKWKEVLLMRMNRLNLV